MAEKCPLCGAPLENDHCDYCGYSAPAGPEVQATFVAAPTQVTIQQNQTVLSPNLAAGVSAKSKIAALLLCIFLGGLGVHRFYVGKIGTGFLYLFTCGLCGIGWIVDIFLIASGSFKDQMGLPLRN